MKKFLTAIAALAVLATPVAAEARHGDGPRHERSRGDNVGTFLGGLVVGAIIGSAAANSRNRTYDDGYEVRELPRDTYYRRQRVCFEEQIVEYYYGQRYIRYEYRCR
jgi:hypothetical protein